MDAEVSAFAIYAKKKDKTEKKKVSHKIKKHNSDKTDKHKHVKNVDIENPKHVNNVETEKSKSKKRKILDASLDSSELSPKSKSKKKKSHKKSQTEFNGSTISTPEKIPVQNEEKTPVVVQKEEKTPLVIQKEEKTPVDIKKSSEKHGKTKHSSEKSKSKKKHSKESKNELIVWDLDGEESSVECGRKLFQWVMSPVPENKFFNDNWEIRPLHIARHCETYYSTLLSCEMINTALREQMLYFGKNIDITSYTDNVRETHNPEGRANAPVVWDFFRNGCSVRMLNPQTFFRKIESMNSRLQEYFGCFVGANVYLTPAGSQGFAPHYDDIEAFVLQIEGKKKWKLYGPKSPSDILPRESSKNFTEDEIGPMIMEVILEAGDILYFPRGIVHQAAALEDTHSLHITLSVYQKNSWADFLEKLIPAALNSAIEEDVSFRRGLPMHYLSHVGVVHCDTESEQRKKFIETLQALMVKLVDYAPIDAAADQMGKKFMIDALPSCITKKERCRTVVGDGEIIHKGVVSNTAEMQLDTKIKLLRYNALRLITEEDKVRIYYSINNSREYHGEEPQFLEIEDSLAPAVEYLIKKYPSYVTVENLPLETDEEKARIAADLWETGLLITEEPLGYTSN